MPYVTAEHKLSKRGCLSVRGLRISKLSVTAKYVMQTDVKLTFETVIIGCKIFIAILNSNNLTGIIKDNFRKKSALMADKEPKTL